MLPMRCPACATEMIDGRLELGTSFLSRALLDARTTGTTLRFVRDDGDEVEEVELARPVSRCPSCEVLIISGVSDAFACFECEAEIPAGAKACPSCGWSW